MTRTVLLPAGVALSSLAADAAAKAWALSALGAGRQITAAGGLLRLRLVANHGAAFGIGSGSEPLVALHGAVTDWIHVSFYGPTFNLADVWLRGGILLAALAWLWNRRARPAGPG